MRLGNLPLTLLLLCCSFTATAAQDATRDSHAAAPPVVTASARAEGVRFAALGAVDRLRLEIYDRGGEMLLYDSGLAAGNVRDWPLVDRAGARLPDGAYVYVVTARDASGRLSLKQGVLLVEGGAAAVSLGESAPAGGVTQGDPAPAGGAATLATHDGRDGAVTSTAGALTLRTGDLLAGGDREHVRVTPEGRVGIGTDSPQATLDVAGAISVREGIRFADGTTLGAARGRLRLTNAEGEEAPAPSAAGTGTQGRLAKWLETGGAGTLGDSVITETAAGNIGISNPSPTTKLSVLGAPGAELRFDKGAQSITPVLNVISQPASTTSGGAAGLAAGGGGTSFNFSDNLPFFIVKDTKANVVNNNLGFGTPLFTVQPSGNVGVGTTSPASTLDVAGNINTSTQFNIGGQRAFISSVSSISAIVFAGVGAGLNNTSEGTNNSFIGFRAGQNNTSGNANTFLGSVAGQNNSTGAFNVFLGRAAGTQNLTGSRNTLIGANAAVGASNLTDATAIGANSRVDTSNSVVLGDLGAKVGIGTQAPTHRLTIGATETPVVTSALVGVYGAGSAYSIVRDTTNNVEALFGADAGGALYGSLTNHDVQFRINNSARMRIFKDGGARITGGTVEVGTGGSDLSSLVVNGSIFVGTLGNEGEVSLCAGPIVVVRQLSRCSSSIRYKTDVRDFTPGLDLLNRLRPVSFRWKKSGNGDLGFVAEEVAEAEPRLTTRNERGEVEGVKYDRITAVLVNAVREQQMMIESQRKRIEELERAFKARSARRLRAARGRR